MRPSIMRAFSGLLGFALTFASVEARVAEMSFPDTVLEYNYQLQPRADDSCRLQTICWPCSEGGCKARKFKHRRRHDDNVVANTDIFHNSTHNEGPSSSEHSLVKRVFQTVDQTNVGNYVEQQGELPTALSLDGTYPNGSDTSFTRQLRFQDYITSNPTGIVMGTGQTLLTGCTVITIVSRRAVYMGHFWQNYAFDSSGLPEWEDGPNAANVVANVINLIAGQQPLYYAQGPALDVTLFNQATDLPFAFILTPRDPTSSNFGSQPPAQTLYYNAQIQLISARIQQLLPNLQLVLTIPYISEEEYDANALERGTALFEYDPNADGKGNGNWRLFYEESVTDGRSRGQDVVGVNKPT